MSEKKKRRWHLVGGWYAVDDDMLAAYLKSRAKPKELVGLVSVPASDGRKVSLWSDNTWSIEHRKIRTKKKTKSP